MHSSRPMYQYELLSAKHLTESNCQDSQLGTNRNIPHLHEEAEVGEHSEAAVLELLHAQLSEGIGIVSQAEGVEGATCKQTDQVRNAAKILRYWARRLLEVKESYNNLLSGKEIITWVELVKALNSWCLTSGTECLCLSHEGNLHGTANVLSQVTI